MLSPMTSLEVLFPAPEAPHMATKRLGEAFPMPVSNLIP